MLKKVRNTVVRVEIVTGSTRVWISFGSIDPLLARQRVHCSFFRKAQGIGRILMGGRKPSDHLSESQQRVVGYLLETLGDVPSGYLIEDDGSGPTSMAAQYTYPDGFLRSVAETLRCMCETVGATIGHVETTSRTWVLSGETYVDIGLHFLERAELPFGV